MTSVTDRDARARTPGAGKAAILRLLEIPISQFAHHDRVRISADTRVREALRAMEATPDRHLLVQDADDRTIGILSDRDLLRHVSPYAGTIAEQERDLSTLRHTVSLIAAHRLVTIQQDMPLYEAVPLMKAKRISALAVADHDGAVIGLASIHGILDGLLQLMMDMVAEHSAPNDS